MALSSQELSMDLTEVHPVSDHLKVLEIVSIFIASTLSALHYIASMTLLPSGLVYAAAAATAPPFFCTLSNCFCPVVRSWRGPFIGPHM